MGIIQNNSGFKIGNLAPKPLRITSEAEIKRDWVGNKIKVSVLCATYQHADFIEDALFGFLGQKTNFPFEIIIRDDASSDGTTEIIERYASEYADIIKPIFEEKNTWPKIRPEEFMRSRAEGKYVATCEGDDYWIDSLKLQKQVDFIEQHKNISLVSCKAIHIEKGRIIGFGKGGTRTNLYPRNIDFPNVDDYREYIYHGDNLTASILKLHGEKVILEDTMAVWRKHSSGVWSSLTEGDKNKQILNYRRASTRFWIGVIHLEAGRKRLGHRDIAKSFMHLLNIFPKDRFKIMGSLIRYWFFTPLIRSIKSLFTYNFFKK